MLHPTLTVEYVLDGVASLGYCYNCCMLQVKPQIINNLLVMLDNSCDQRLQIKGSVSCISKGIKSIDIPHTEVNCDTRFDEWFDKTFIKNAALKNSKYLNRIHLEITGDFDNLDFHEDNTCKKIDIF